LEVELMILFKEALQVTHAVKLVQV